MPRDIAIIAVLLAILVLDCQDHPDASNFRSPQMTSPFRSEGEVLHPGRTGKLILANDVKQNSPPSDSNSGRSPPAPRADPSEPGSNRDLDLPRRATPEAADDLFQLLKQAGPKQASKPK